MSTQKHTFSENHSFVERFIEICQTSKPAEVSRLLSISYQASKNYLEGIRLPDTQTLKQISNITGCSIDWLLMGKGKKFIRDNVYQDTPLLFDQLKPLIRTECEKVVAEMLHDRSETVEGKTIVLEQEDIKEEKVMDENSHSSFKNPIRHK